VGAGGYTEEKCETMKSDTCWLLFCDELQKDIEGDPAATQYVEYFWLTVLRKLALKQPIREKIKGNSYLDTLHV
jgi:hypothetical protein